MQEQKTSASVRPLGMGIGVGRMGVQGCRRDVVGAVGRFGGRWMGRDVRASDGAKTVLSHGDILRPLCLESQPWLGQHWRSCDASKDEDRCKSTLPLPHAYPSMHYVTMSFVTSYLSNSGCRRF